MLLNTDRQYTTKSTVILMITSRRRKLKEKESIYSIKKIYIYV